jgi:hypothetical protein
VCYCNNNTHMIWFNGNHMINYSSTHMIRLNGNHMINYSSTHMIRLNGNLGGQRSLTFQVMKQILLYLWYPLFQAQWNRCDEVLSSILTRYRVMMKSIHTSLSLHTRQSRIPQTQQSLFTPPSHYIQNNQGYHRHSKVYSHLPLTTYKTNQLI